MQLAPRMTSRAMAWAALIALIATMAFALLASWGSGSASDNGPTLKSPMAAKDGGSSGSGRRRV